MKSITAVDVSLPCSSCQGTAMDIEEPSQGKECNVMIVKFNHEMSAGEEDAPLYTTSRHQHGRDWSRKDSTEQEAKD